MEINFPWTRLIWMCKISKYLKKNVAHNIKIPLIAFLKRKIYMGQT